MNISNEQINAALHIGAGCQRRGAVFSQGRAVQIELSVGSGIENMASGPV